jgi:hypothetical protein
MVEPIEPFVLRQTATENRQVWATFRPGGEVTIHGDASAIMVRASPSYAYPPDRDDEFKSDERDG